MPRENIILAEGKGLRVALTTLNTGRLTLPAACTGLAKRCLEASRAWANERVQWGAPIGKHAAIADKIARMAADVFAMEAMTFYTASLVDRDKKADIRLEAAMCKMWASERAWEIVNDTMQIRGGRGYETAASQAARGEKPVRGRTLAARLPHQHDLRGLERNPAPLPRARGAGPASAAGRADALNSRFTSAERAASALKAGRTTPRGIRFYGGR